MPTVTVYISDAQAQWLKESEVNKSQLMQLAIEALMLKAAAREAALTRR